MQRPRAHENANEFVPHAFPRYLFEQLCVFRYSLRRFCFDRKIEFRRNAYRTQHSQCVLSESFIRISDRHYHLPFQVGQALVRVYQLLNRGIVRNGIDAEIAPVQIVFELVAEGYFIGVPGVRVLAFDAVRGDLYDFQARVFGLCDDTDGPILVLIECFGEKLLYLFRLRVRRDVPVFRFALNEEVTHTPTHQVCLKSWAAQRFGHITDLPRNIELGFHQFIVYPVFITLPPGSKRISQQFRRLP